MAAHGVERPLGQGGGIADPAMDDRKVDAGFLDVLLGDAQHPFRWIEQRDVVAAFGERDRDDSGPAADVQHTSGRWRQRLAQTFQQQAEPDPAAGRGVVGVEPLGAFVERRRHGRRVYIRRIMDDSSVTEVFLHV